MILIVGKHFAPLRKFLDKHGVEQFLLCDESASQTASKHNVPGQLASFKSRDDLHQILPQLPPNITGVITMFENYVLPAAWLAEDLGINGLPVASALACTDKDLMRQAFATAPEPISPDFAVINSWDDAHNFATSHTFPLILKPANLAKSLLVSRCDDLESLRSTYEKTMGSIQSIYEKYAPTRKPKLIIEEYLQGSVHSVDAFVDGQGQPFILDSVVDYQTGYDMGFNDNFHYSRLIPSRLSAAEQATVKHVASLGIEALGMRYSPAHVEIIMTPKGPRIVEIGARNGGYRARMHRLANGLSLYRQLLNTITDKPIKVTSRRHEGCAVLELFPYQPGSFLDIEHQAELRQLASLKYFSIKAQAGQYVGLSSDGYKACAIIILHHPDQQQFQADLAFVNQQVRVRT